MIIVKNRWLQPYSDQDLIDKWQFVVSIFWYIFCQIIPELGERNIWSDVDIYWAKCTERGIDTEDIWEIFCLQYAKSTDLVEAYLFSFERDAIRVDIHYDDLVAHSVIEEIHSCQHHDEYAKEYSTKDHTDDDEREKYTGSYCVPGGAFFSMVGKWPMELIHTNIKNYQIQNSR